MAVDHRLLLRPYLFFFSFFSTITLLGLFPSTHSLTESEALLKLKDSFTKSDVLDSWVPGSSPCIGTSKWRGILCYNGIVTGISLQGLGLSGKIDVSALRGIRGLRIISFANNSFSGSIPDLSSFGALRAIYLSDNQFSDDVPWDYFSKMVFLKKLWLSNNRFVGNIPFSLSQLSRLVALHLENNRFRGSIPSLDMPILVSLNFSNNKLEGEIPASLSKFDMSSFAGNGGLCGEKLGRKCRITAVDSKKIVAGSITSGVVILSIAMLLILRSKRKRKEKFDKLGEEGEKEAPVEVHVSSLNKKEMDSVRKESVNQSITKGGGNAADIVMVNDEKGVFGMTDLMKASAEMLGNGGMGSSYKAVMANGIAVVVKRIKDTNVKGKDQFDEEIRRLGKLGHWNVLSPLAYHYRKEEKLVVYEYVPNGSLLYLLHGERGSSHIELNWPARLKIVQGIAKGLGYLHTELSSFDLPHGNLKSSNVLLGPGCEPLISDFGYSPLINPSSASQALFAYKAPEFAQSGQVSPKSDVYCLGIVILEILTGKFPAQYLDTGKGGTDVAHWVTSAISEGRDLVELLDPEISNLTSRNSLGEMLRLLHIGAACTESNPELRLSTADAIRRIEEIRVEGGQEDTSRTMQVLPSLRDGYAESTPKIDTEAGLGGELGEVPERRKLQNGERFAFAIS